MIQFWSFIYLTYASLTASSLVSYLLIESTEICSNFEKVWKIPSSVMSITIKPG
jgi:hypothetical protein